MFKLCFVILNYSLIVLYYCSIVVLNYKFYIIDTLMFI